MSEAETNESDELAVAIGTAKDFVRRVLKDESIENVGVEEVKPPDYGSIWHITLGYDRPRSRPPSLRDAAWMPNSFMQAAAAAAARPVRVYKVVEVDVAKPKALSMTNRKED